MDRELEEQIEELIQKFNKDLRSKILRLVSKHVSKTVKEQLKGGSTTSSNRGGRKTAAVPKKLHKSEPVESESDEYSD